MATDTIERLDLTRTFAHPVNVGDIDAVPLTTAFWRGQGAAASGDRFVGIVAFSSSGERHTSSQELHADGDELILVPAGALDGMIDDGTSESAIALDVGHAVVVPRGAWHRLVAPQSGRLFVHQRPDIDAEPIPSRRSGQPVIRIDIDQIDIAHDMAATLAFYRRLGVPIPDDAVWRTSTGIHHVDVTTPSGPIVHFDSPQLAAAYKTGWRQPDGAGSGNVLSFEVAERDDVDELHRRLTDLGHPSSQAPYDASGDRDSRSSTIPTGTTSAS